MDDLTSWAQRHGVSAAALADLHATLGCFPAPAKLRLGAPRSESHIQSLVRLSEARDGCTLWRNNVGAGKLDNGSFVRWGLANESEQMNRQIKSSDLIGWRRVTITPQMVGRTIAQFVARETKHPDWRYTGTEREVAQERFILLVRRDGGDAAFTNGDGYA